MLHEVAAADAQPANLDQAGQLHGQAGPQLSAGCVETGHGRRRPGWPGKLPGAAGQDQIEGEARLAGAGGPADQNRAVADLDGGGVDARVAQYRSWRAAA